MVAVDVVVVYDDAIGDGDGDDDGNHGDDGSHDDSGDGEVKSLCGGGVLGEKGRHESAYQPGQGASNLKNKHQQLSL